MQCAAKQPINRHNRFIPQQQVQIALGILALRGTQLVIHYGRKIVIIFFIPSKIWERNNNKISIIVFFFSIRRVLIGHFECDRKETILTDRMQWENQRDLLN